MRPHTPSKPNTHTHTSTRTHDHARCCGALCASVRRTARLDAVGGFWLLCCAICYAVSVVSTSALQSGWAKITLYMTCETAPTRKHQQSSQRSRYLTRIQLRSRPHQRLSWPPPPLSPSAADVIIDVLGPGRACVVVYFGTCA